MSGLGARKASQSELQTPRTRVDNEEDVELKYKLGRELGRGAFGVVLEGTQLSSGKVFAVKVIPKERGPQMELIDREVEVLQSLRHPHIIHLEEVLETPKKIYIVMDLCAGGLSERIKQHGPYAEKDARVIMEQLTGAVFHMHQKGMVHRDLKLENILITAGSNPLDIQVTDFGLAYKRQKGFAGEEERMLDGTCGTLLYMAPEVLENKLVYSDHCDVWSLGVILYELLCGHVPFYDTTSVAKLSELIHAGKVEFSEPEWADISDEAKDLITRMLHVDTTRRLRVGEVLDHQWLKGGGAAKSHMDIFQMMQEVNGLNGGGELKTVNEEEEGVSTPKERRKELQRPSVEAPTREDRGAAKERRKESSASFGEPKQRSRLKSDSYVHRSTFQGGAPTVPKDPNKKMARSLHSTSELPSKSGRRSSSDSSQPTRMRQSSSYSSLKEKK